MIIRMLEEVFGFDLLSQLDELNLDVFALVLPLRPEDDR